MKNLPFLRIVAVALLATGVVPGQTSPNPQFEGKTSAVAREQSRFLYGDYDIRRGTRRNDPNLRNTTAILRESKASPELIKARKVSGPLREQYASVLRLPDAGIFRLLRDPKCDSSSDEHCARKESEWLVFGQSYSFIDEKHNNPIQSQLTLSGDQLISAGQARQTVFTDLGDADIADLSLSSDGLKYLAGFQPASDISSADEQWQRFNRGVDEGGYRYRQSLWLRTSSVYALRSIRYKLKASSAPWNWDVTAVFKIVSLDSDGITVVYRVLDKKKGPELIY